MLVKFSCRLPAQLREGDDRGFLDLTTGRFTPDRKARLVKVPGSWDDWHTIAAPVLRGFVGATYSWSARRWLPSDRLQVAPDGLHYAYPEVPTPNVGLKIHVVDLRAGTDRVVSTGVNWGILDYRSDGLYLTRTTYYAGEGNSGLWRMNPTTGSVLQLLPEAATTLFLGGAAAWGSDKPIEPTILYRYELATGSRTVWFARPNTFVQYAGIDGGGHPLVNVWSGDVSPARQLLLLLSPTHSRILYSSAAQDGPTSAVSLPDSHGVWLGSLSGLWLLQPSGSFLKVSAAPVYPLGDCS
jgi:hypothetical protein